MIGCRRTLLDVHSISSESIGQGHPEERGKPDLKKGVGPSSSSPLRTPPPLDTDIIARSCIQAD